MSPVKDGWQSRLFSTYIGRAATVQLAEHVQHDRCGRKRRKKDPLPLLWRVAVGLTTPMFWIIIGCAGLSAQTRGADSLQERADAVVVGELLSTYASGKSASAVLSVIRTIKGGLRSNDRATVSWNLRHAVEKDLKGAYGLWFLRETSPAQWTLIEPIRGSLYIPLPKDGLPAEIALPANIAAISAPVTAGDQIAAEAVKALQVYKTRQDARQLATMFLATEGTPFIRDVSRVLKSSVDPELKFIGLTAMLRLNDLTALTEMGDNIDLIPRVMVGPDALFAVMSRREWSPDVIATLGKFAMSQDPEVQYAGALAMSRIHTRDTLPSLVRVLDSPRPLTRQMAMMGLTAFVRNLPIETPGNVANGRAGIPQGPAPYRTTETDRYWVGGTPLAKEKEAEYVQFWKTWWARMGSELMKR